MSDNSLAPASSPALKAKQKLLPLFAAIGICIGFFLPLFNGPLHRENFAELRSKDVNDGPLTEGDATITIDGKLTGYSSWRISCLTILKTLQKPRTLEFFIDGHYFPGQEITDLRVAALLLLSVLILAVAAAIMIVIKPVRILIWAAGSAPLSILIYFSYKLKCGVKVRLHAVSDCLGAGILTMISCGIVLIFFEAYLADRKLSSDRKS